MTETPPPRRALATFLRRPGTERPADPAAPAELPAVTALEPEAPADPAAAPIPAGLAEGSGEQSAAETAQAPATAETAAAEADTDAQMSDLASPAGPMAPGGDTARAEASNDAPLQPAAAADDNAAWRATELPIVASTAAPTFARKHARAPSQRAPLWQWLALAALALLLGLQILLADRARLAADAGWRPTLSALCGVFGCTLPPWHEPAAFSMLDRDVRPAPNENGALRIQASFRNDARWAQAWPWLQLSLSDADGRVIGTRVFAPAEYLGHPPEDPDLLAPGQSARIDFRVREPAAGTAAFNFDFR